MQKYEQAYKATRKQIFINNLIGGLAWGLGATIGLGLVLAILGILAKQVGLIPIVGTFVSDIINFVLQTNPNLHH